MPDLFAQRTKEDYAFAGRSLQPTYLAAGLKHSQAAFSLLLFSYCVHEYKMHPSKAKALFIWERFLENIGKGCPTAGAYDPNVINVEVDECGKDGVLERIELKVREMRAARFTALSMNKAMRALTGYQRKAPDNLFDAFLAAHVARTGDSPWKDLQNRLHEDRISSPTIYRSLKNKLPQLKQDLAKAGFDWVAKLLPIGP